MRDRSRADATAVRQVGPATHVVAVQPVEVGVVQQAVHPVDAPLHAQEVQRRVQGIANQPVAEVAEAAEGASDEGEVLVRVRPAALDQPLAHGGGERVKDEGAGRDGHLQAHVLPLRLVQPRGEEARAPEVVDGEGPREAHAEVQQPARQHVARPHGDGVGQVVPDRGGQDEAVLPLVGGLEVHRLRMERLRRAQVLAQHVVEPLLRRHLGGARRAVRGDEEARRVHRVQRRGQRLQRAPETDLLHRGDCRMLHGQVGHYADHSDVDCVCDVPSLYHFAILWSCNA